MNSRRVLPPSRTSPRWRTKAPHPGSTTGPPPFTIADKPGIKVHGFFIFGSDFDDKTVFQKTVDICQETEIDFPSFSALTPYVGTDVRSEFEKTKRIFTNNWEYYDGAHVVFHPKNMSPYELQEGLISAFENFYSKTKSMHHIMKGEVFYGLGTFYVRHLLKKIIQENVDSLEYLRKLSK